MRVYVVIAEPYNMLTDDAYTIEKIFDSVEKAEAYVKEKNNVKKEDREYIYSYYGYKVE